MPSGAELRCFEGTPAGTPPLTEHSGTRVRPRNPTAFLVFAALRPRVVTLRSQSGAGGSTRNAGAPPSEIDFEVTVEDARAGSNAALGALHRRLAPSVLAYLRARLPVGAEDVAAEVWTEVTRGLSRFRGDEVAFRAWVFTIARLRLADEPRQRGAVRTENLALAAEADDDAERGAGTFTPTVAAGRLAVLPAHHADVLLLRVVGGLSIDETAYVLGKSPGRVRAMQRGAVEYLARHLGEQDDA